MGKLMQELVNTKSKFIPSESVGYMVSEYNGDTNHLRKNSQDIENQWTCYAVVFFKSI
ncbi:hypothetical protein HOD29_02505 [archaeon]|nr:hypothetical protein [archaeon]